jgi:hypothetical protein
MNIIKLDNSQKIIVLEYVENGQKDRLIFDNQTAFKIKEFTKEFKKKGTISFIIVDGEKTKTIVKSPEYISILKVVESYVKEKEDVE